MRETTDTFDGHGEAVFVDSPAVVVDGVEMSYKVTSVHNGNRDGYQKVTRSEERRVGKECPV